MMAPAAFGRVRYCRFVHTETARAKPMHSKGLWRPDSEEFSAHPEPSRTPAAHARGRPASSRLLCELLDRILAGVHGRALGGFTDRLGIRHVVLVPLDKGLDVSR